MSSSESICRGARRAAGADLLERLRARRLTGSGPLRGCADIAWPQRGALDEAAGVLDRVDAREDVGRELAWR